MEEQEDPNIIEALELLFIKDIKSHVPKKEIELFLWLTKSGLFVKAEFISNFIDYFLKFYQDKTQHQISSEKAYQKFFCSRVNDSHYLLIGNSVVVGSCFDCATTNLRGIGVRLYEGIPLDSSVSIHQSDPIFLEYDYIKAKLLADGFNVVFNFENRTFQIPFERLSYFINFFKTSKDLKKYLHLKTIRGFIRTFAQSLKRSKPFSISAFTIFPKDLLKNKQDKWLRTGDTLVVTSDNQIKYLYPLSGKFHQDHIRQELNEFANIMKNKKFCGAKISLKKDSFFATYEISQIVHSFGISAFFSFLDAIFEYHHINKRYPGKLSNKASVDEVIKCFTGILQDALPILPEKIPPKIKNHLNFDVSSCLISKNEWFFTVDKSKMIREIFYQPKKMEKTIVPINLPPV